MYCGSFTILLALVYGGEVDCCTKGSPKEYVELKTTRIMDNIRQHNNFKSFKLIKWWAQSFLIGIKKIVVGYRDDDGIVKYVDTMDTLGIPNMCKVIIFFKIICQIDV